MMLFLLDHKRWIDDEYYDTKFIGVFSSHSMAFETIKQYSSLPGFCKFSSGFHIEPLIVSPKLKSLNSKAVYILTINQVLNDDEITVAYCAYSNLFYAKAAQLIKSIASYGKKNKKY